MKKSRVNLGEADFVMFCVILLLLTIGLIMVYSASSWTASIQYKDDMHFLKRQGPAAVIGIIAMLFFMRFDYHKIKKYTILMMILCVPLLLAVFLFPGAKGAQRWINLGPISIQPSEIVKYVMVLYLAKSIDYKGERIKSLLYGVLPYLFVAGAYAGLILLEKNLSICAVIMIVTLILLFVGGARLWHIFGLVAPVCTVAGIMLIFTASYRKARLLNFIDPWKDASGNGYQLIQSLYALGSGGIWGVGLGQSRQKAYYMPEPHNDFIFSIIGEELGLIGCILIISLFMILVWRGIRTAINSKDTYGTLLATGITSVIAIQAIINIAVVSGSMPVTGVPLPFISYGGSSLVLNLSAMGILLNVSRQIDRKRMY
ncbi:stage V sporulation protein E [Clostridium sp. 19966]|uniref:stage V sporulation protein E n=1 Tax=Clostridium sp. 19966 TaxID=2768166 RepID=UPI0028DF2401|nr:stage V sporulation protein E [Clostridium sp. 19966]MDT8716620.1 stage V sporulation protein E [Clostridium sp. 19966]